MEGAKEGNVRGGHAKRWGNLRLPFKEGQEYLVYAFGKEEPLKVDLCSETKRLSKADAEIAWLGKFGNSEKPLGSADTLSDTSGFVPVGAMVGMACLVMAASF